MCEKSLRSHFFAASSQWQVCGPCCSSVFCWLLAALTGFLSHCSRLVTNPYHFFCPSSEYSSILFSIPVTLVSAAYVIQGSVLFLPALVCLAPEGPYPSSLSSSTVLGTASSPVLRKGAVHLEGEYAGQVHHTNMGTCSFISSSCLLPSPAFMFFQPMDDAQVRGDKSADAADNKQN